MKISLNWLKKYVDINISSDELIRLIGTRLVEVEGVIDETHKYNNIYVVKVVECEKIEGTHLSLCRIDAGGVLLDHSRPTGSEPSEARPVTTGESERVQKDTAASFIQVVCGAPNVHAGMLAAWIAPGAIVPASVHEDAPFVIGKRRMLGKYDSNGMLAGADELDFGDDHSGIVEIDPSLAKPGDKLADIFELNDLILEIENKSLTHRPDCFGLIGFAREVAGILGQKFGYDSETENVVLRGIRSHDEDSVRNPVTTGVTNVPKNHISVSISDTTLCPRYSALILEKHGEISKKYLTYEDTILSKSGMKPISPIVDATNFIMLLTGQPLHAFDYDKFVAVGKSDTPKILVRAAKKGEKLQLLDDTEITLTHNDIVITSNDIPVALAGAMGGKSTMIDENTRNIILESATFSLYNLRKTQMAHGVFTEAITRFTKGQPACQTVAAASVCADMLKDGFKISALVDECPTPLKQSVVKITTLEINNLLGTDYSEELIKSTLGNVGFRISTSGANLEITAPLWRTDIHIKEDIIEEIGRLLGYDNITPTLPLHATATKDKMLSLKTKIRNILKSSGANELLTYSFIHGDLIKKVGQDEKNSFCIVNSISPDLQYIRQAIVPSLLSKVYENIRDGHSEFAIFEMNQTFSKQNNPDKDGVPIPDQKLALVVAKSQPAINYYLAKKYLENLLYQLGIDFTLMPFSSGEKYYEKKRSADIMIGAQKIGTIGEIRNPVARNLKLAAGVAAFELDLSYILDADISKAVKSTTSIYPSVLRDITIATQRPYSAIYDSTKKVFEDRNLIYKITPSSIYQSNDESTKNISFHLKFSNPLKTMTASEISEIMAELEKL